LSATGSRSGTCIASSLYILAKGLVGFLVDLRHILRRSLHQQGQAPVKTREAQTSPFASEGELVKPGHLPQSIAVTPG
jgi:hypothetical protein